MIDFDVLFESLKTKQDICIAEANACRVKENQQISIVKLCLPAFTLPALNVDIHFAQKLFTVTVCVTVQILSTVLLVQLTNHYGEIDLLISIRVVKRMCCFQHYWMRSGINKVGDLIFQNHELDEEYLYHTIQNK